MSRTFIPFWFKSEIRGKLLEAFLKFWSTSSLVYTNKAELNLNFSSCFARDLVLWDPTDNDSNIYLSIVSSICKGPSILVEINGKDIIRTVGITSRRFCSLPFTTIIVTLYITITIYIWKIQLFNWYSYRWFSRIPCRWFESINASIR